MPTLYDKLTASQPQPTASQPGQQSAIEQLLAAKKGKIGAPAPAPAASNIGEQAVQQQANQQLKQGALAGAIQGAGAAVERQGLEQQAQTAGAQQNQEYALKQQEITSGANRAQAATAATTNMQMAQLDAAKQRKLKGINAQAESELRKLAAQGQLETDDIFSSFQRSNKELEFRQDAAQLEQLGTLLALQDRQYMDELNRIGEQRRLYDESEWQKEKQRVVYGANLDALMADLNFKRGEDAKQRTFEKQLASIGIDQALAMAQAALKDEAQRQAWTAGISGISAAAGADWDKLKPYEAPDSTDFAPVRTDTAATASPSFSTDVTGAGPWSVTSFKP